jgi:putative membrane protein
VRLFSVLAAILGLVLIAALIAHFGTDAVIGALGAIGWAGFAAICLIHIALIAIMGIAWGALLPGTRAWVPIWGRLVRDAGSELLPLSQVGGYVLGARAITLAGVPGTAATASTTVDVTLELFGQLAYTALALCWLLHLRPGAAVAIPIAIGLAVGGVLASAFVAVQRRGLNLFDRFARLMGRGWADKTAQGAAALHAALREIYRRRARVWGSFWLHLFCWIASTLEAWLALQLAGAPLDFPTVLVLESLLYAARSVAFAVPNALGVQEGAYIVLGAGLGLTPEMGLALSLLKRARDLVIGLPALAGWQFVESGRFWARSTPVTRSAGPGSETPVAMTGASASPAGSDGKANEHRFGLKSAT